MCEHTLLFCISYSTRLQISCLHNFPTIYAFLCFFSYIFFSSALIRSANSCNCALLNRIMFSFHRNATRVIPLLCRRAHVHYAIQSLSIRARVCVVCVAFWFLNVHNYRSWLRDAIWRPFQKAFQKRLDAQQLCMANRLMPLRCTLRTRRSSSGR